MAVKEKKTPLRTAKYGASLHWSANPIAKIIYKTGATMNKIMLKVRAG